MKKIITVLEKVGQTGSLQQADGLKELCKGDVAQAQAFEKLLSQFHDQVCIQFPDDDDEEK